MIKHVLALIVLSILVIMTTAYAQESLQLLVRAHDFISTLLMQVFSGGDAGNLIRKLFALLTIPVAVALVPVLIYWLTRRAWFPYFMQLVWVIWLVQTAAIIITYKSAIAVAAN